jgi:glycosyltransferase involved in cell wall biosynthesis/precorrin-6B methylase 2
MTDSNNALVPTGALAAHVFSIRTGASRYWMYLPDAVTDAVQRAVAESARPYWQSVLDDASARLRPGEFVLDIGADVGHHSIPLACVAGCRVLAFEEEGTRAAVLRRSARLNGVEDRVEVRVGRVGTASGLAIDDLGVAETVAMIRIAVTGDAENVLAGATATLARDRPLVYAVFDVAPRLGSLLQWLGAQNYVCCATFDGAIGLFVPAERADVRQLARLQGSLFQQGCRAALSLLPTMSHRPAAIENALPVSDARCPDVIPTGADEALQEALARGRALAAELEQQRTVAREARESQVRLTQQLQQVSVRVDRLLADQKRLRGLALGRAKALEELSAEHQRVVSTVRYQLGAALVEAARSPRAMLALPWRVWKALSRVPVEPRVEEAQLSEPTPEFEAASLDLVPVLLVREFRRWGAVQAADPCVGALLADHDRASLGSVARLLPLDPASDEVTPADAWLLQVDVLIRSCTEGAAAAARWEARLEAAAAAGVPIVLWCDVGPEQRPDYLSWARRAHMILTEDLDAVSTFRMALGHERVHAWPRWARPQIAHPFSAQGRQADAPRTPVVIDVEEGQAQSLQSTALLDALGRLQRPVASYSRTLHLLWGDLVVSSDSPVQRDRLLQADEPASALAHLAWRRAWHSHGPQSRLDRLAQWLASDPVAARPADVLVVAQAGNPAEAEAVIASWQRQSYRTPLWLVTQADWTPDDKLGSIDVRVFDCVTKVAQGLIETAVPWLVVFDARDSYGPEYLADLRTAAQADVAQVYAKPSDTSTSWRLVEGETVPWRRALLPSELVATLLGREPGSEVVLGERCSTSGRVGYTDSYHYGADGALWATPEAQLDGRWTGLTWQAIETQVACCLEHTPWSATPLRVDPPLTVEPRLWFSWLPAAQPAGLAWNEDDEAFHLEWSGSDKVEYLYLQHRIPLDQLKPGQQTLWTFDGTPRGDVRAVLVFYDARGRKISHLMQQVGARGVLQVPEGTQHAQLAIRLKDRASATLTQIGIGMPRLPARLPVSMASTLLIAKQYPSYEHLYRFGFVHSRIRGYRSAGRNVEIYKLNQDGRGSFREFEGVPVQEGDAKRLTQAITCGGYRCLLVHYMDRNVWPIVRDQLPYRRVVIWVHGAEIQPWWRRAYLHVSDAARDLARRHSDERMAMWREVLSTSSENLQLVFVSAKQAGEAFSDLGIFPPAHRYRVISNFIDEQVFPYRPKTAEHRRRILSIRPYASAVYANDLTVKAILRLSQWPGFEQLQFRLIGDGPLFDETVEPLRRFPNVELERRFLNQHEIAEVHNQYGIFLVPSRMDSQGVSRDEAMSSGLVPVSTRIAAIPEFVTPDCAILAEPEDSDGLADAIIALQEDPERFLRMSAAAAMHVRSRSGRLQTIDKEMALIQGRDGPSPQAPIARPPHHVVVCGDLNLNIMDGSAIWAASLAETLSLLPGVGVTVFCKARIHRTQVISRLLDLTPQVRLVEPPLPDRARVLDIQGMLDGLEELDRQQPVDGWVLRGFDLCTAAAARPAFRGRLWAYLTDIPQRDEDITPENSARIVNIIHCCSIFFCQTPQFEAFVHRHWPMSQPKTRILSPMVPPATRHPRTVRLDQPFRVAYAGKFAPLWGIRELFRSFAALRVQLPDAELHVYGDKIHNAPDDPGYREEIRARLEGGDGLVWHGAVDRAQLIQALTGMDVCWAYRDPRFERSTHELSTKVLEYASIGVPIILARSEPNEAALGVDYPLFADSEPDAIRLLADLAVSDTLRRDAVRAYEELAHRHSFAAVAQSLMRQGVLLRGQDSR